MAGYKRAKFYRVFHYATGPKAGTTTIIVAVEGGGSYWYRDLSPGRAHHIIDLLRNEDPVWVELESGMLQVSVEPVGEGD